MGPRTDPCGTPLLTVSQSDPSVLTSWFLLDKNKYPS